MAQEEELLGEGGAAAFVVATDYMQCLSPASGATRPNFSPTCNTIGEQRILCPSASATATACASSRLRHN